MAVPLPKRHTSVVVHANEDENSAAIGKAYYYPKSGGRSAVEETIYFDPRQLVECLVRCELIDWKKETEQVLCFELRSWPGTTDTALESNNEKCARLGALLNPRVKRYTWKPPVTDFVLYTTERTLLIHPSETGTSVGLRAMNEFYTRTFEWPGANASNPGASTFQRRPVAYLTGDDPMDRFGEPTGASYFAPIPEQRPDPDTKHYAQAKQARPRGGTQTPAVAGPELSANQSPRPQPPAVAGTGAVAPDTAPAELQNHDQVLATATLGPPPAGPLPIQLPPPPGVIVSDMASTVAAGVEAWAGYEEDFASLHSSETDPSMPSLVSGRSEAASSTVSTPSSQWTTVYGSPEQGRSGS